MSEALPDDFYETIKPRLHRRIGRELRLARRLLDLGCGNCDLVRYLARAHGHEVTGVDVKAEGFPSRRRTRRGHAYHCRKADAASLAFADTGSFDAVVTMWALHEMADPERVFAEVHRVLRPGGLFLVVDFPRDSLAQRLWDEDYYEPQTLRDLLRGAEFVRVRWRLIARDQVIWARARRPARRDNGPGARSARGTNTANDAPITGGAER